MNEIKLFKYKESQQIVIVMGENEVKVRVEFEFLTGLTEERLSDFFGTEVDFKREYGEDLPQFTSPLVKSPRARELLDAGIIAYASDIVITDQLTKTLQHVEKLLDISSKRGVNLDRYVSSYSVIIERAIIQGNLQNALKRLNLAPTFSNLENLSGFQLHNSALFLRSDIEHLSRRFTIALRMSGFIVEKTNMMLSVAVPKSEELISLLNNIPAIIEAIKSDILSE